MVHQGLASMLGRLERPHHCSTHAAVKQDSPQNEETSPPAQLCVEVVTQERQNTQTQGSAHGRHGVGKRTAPHKVVPEDRHSWLEAEAETKTCNNERTSTSGIEYV